MKYYVFDWEMGENYEFESEDEVREYLVGALEDLEPEMHEDALEAIQIIKGEQVVVDL